MSESGPAALRREFCMILDASYLSRGVALHRSLLRHCPSFRMTAVCMDETSERIFEALGMPHLEVMPIAELERAQPRLAAVRDDRTIAEYCWTAKSAVLLELLGRDGIDEATYADSDLLFFGDPAPLFEEMGGDSVLITPHRYLPQHDIGYASGVYNAGYMTFRGDRAGRTVLDWWHERCLEWCYARHEDGRSGDQKYLDDWTERFEGVRALEHVGGALAPWNLGRYELEWSGDHATVDGLPLIFFHYHRVSLEWRSDPSSNGSGRSRSMIRAFPPPVYRPGPGGKGFLYPAYERAIDEAMRAIWAVEPGFDAGAAPAPTARERVQRRLARAHQKALMGSSVVLERGRRRLAGRSQARR
jgi:hypothetical protein